MKARKPFRWRWGRPNLDEDLFNPGHDWAAYIHPERTVILHPGLRRKLQHDLLWLSLGHESVHQIFQHSTPTERRELLAYKHEQAAGEMLHDFWHTARKLGLPVCNGEACPMKKKEGK